MELYEILWVEKTASKDEIKKAYRKLAMEYHPDRNAWNKEKEEKFKQINMAYEILNDDDKRRQYDTFWSTSSNWNPFAWWWINVDLSDIFESFFWGGFSDMNRRWKREFKWEDLQYILNIDLKTSIFWGKESISFHKKEECLNCEWEWGFWKKTCPKCDWRWQITTATQSLFWMIQQTRTCDECSWSGEIFKETCSECLWEKRITTKKKLDIDVPAWIDDEMVIKLTSEWNDWIWTKAKWDLYIKFEVPREEKWLKRDWINLHFDTDIEIVEAVLWTTKEINIPIIWKRKIEIDAGTESWNIIKISWDWVKYIDKDKKWDLFVEVNIKVPKKLSKKERELYEEIAKERKIPVNKWWVLGKLFG